MNNIQQSKQKRIKYIDAMRGFTMLLVVMTHVNGFILGLGSIPYSYYDIFMTFRMPLFFFVSGFVMYKDNYIWNTSNIIAFLNKKIPVQLISPILFLICISVIFHVTFNETLYDRYKNGYWFTFTLFFFYVIYIVITKMSYVFSCKNKWAHDSIFIILGSFVYLLAMSSIHQKLGIPHNIATATGITQFNYFPFFMAGTLVKKYFSKFEYIFDKDKCIACLILLFILVNISHEHIVSVNISIYFLTAGFTGIAIIFAFFRHHAEFMEESIIGKWLQRIGKKTLDIYLIHYFFIYSH